jgi:hypothetical protein
MKTKALRMARRLYNSPFVSRELNRANQLKWARAVRALGPKWKLAENQPLVKGPRLS